MTRSYSTVGKTMQALHGKRDSAGFHTTLDTILAFRAWHLLNQNHLRDDRCKFPELKLNNGNSKPLIFCEPQFKMGTSFSPQHQHQRLCKNIKALFKEIASPPGNTINKTPLSNDTLSPFFLQHANQSSWLSL